MKKIQYIFIFFAVFLLACTGTYSPRPYGYFRIELPQVQYRVMDTLQLPYRFELSSEAKVIARNDDGEKYWIDLEYPRFNAAIHCSYKRINGNLFELSEDSRRYVYKHTVKADGIGETVFENPDRKVYGILYDLKGNTASSLQFVLTDSTKQFFRAALYIDNVPNKDSIAPVIEYLRKDVVQIMETFEWKP